VEKTDKKGWILIHRKIKDNWIWKSSRRFQWWIDILLTVNHEDSKVLIRGKLIDCKRGQCVKSLETWAKEWNVSKGAVRDFFNLLHDDLMISSENLKITTRITVCNYDSYQILVHEQGTDRKRSGYTNNELKELKERADTVKKININPMPHDAR
jgi:hypothetical protein